MTNAADGCVTCHMNDGFGDLTGHSMAMTYEFHGPGNYHWADACTVCHNGTDAEDLDDKVVTLQAATQVQLTALYDLLVASGAMTADNYLAPGVWTTNLVAAVVNYNAIREDKSLGFHYQNYVEAVLTNTIEAVD